jgi:hypothetical protein
MSVIFAMYVLMNNQMILQQNQNMWWELKYKQGISIITSCSVSWVYVSCVTLYVKYCLHKQKIRILASHHNVCGGEWECHYLLTETLG